MSEKNIRPFEVGDLVVSEVNGNGVDDEPDIKTIGIPHKDRKEARDIVAIAAKEFRRFLNESLEPVRRVSRRRSLSDEQLKAVCDAVRAAHKKPYAIRWFIYQKQKARLR